MHELTDKVDRYVSILREETQRKIATKRTYYKNTVVTYAKTECHDIVTDMEVEVSSVEVNINKVTISHLFKNQRVTHWS